MHTWIHLAFGALLALVIGGCVPGGGSGGGSDCDDGDIIACTCPGGPQGIRVCENEVYLPCQCGGGEGETVRPAGRSLDGTVFAMAAWQDPIGGVDPFAGCDGCLP